MSQNVTWDEGRDHPRPCVKAVNRSGVVVRDAVGTNVVLLPFTGIASRLRKMRAAETILTAVNTLP